MQVLSYALQPQCYLIHAFIQNDTYVPCQISDLLLLLLINKQRSDCFRLVSCPNHQTNSGGGSSWMLMSRKTISMTSTTTWQSRLCCMLRMLYENVFCTQTIHSARKCYVPRSSDPPVDHRSGTVHNTRVSARKDGPRARIAYSIHCKNQLTTGSHCGAAL